MPYRVVNGEKQIGRVVKTLGAAEHIVEQKFGTSLSGTGTTAIHIVDETGSIIRVFYVS